MSSFLARSLRRTTHAKHEAEIAKMIAMGQNLEVRLSYRAHRSCAHHIQILDRTWPTIHEQGAVIEEAAEDSDADDTEGSNSNVAVETDDDTVDLNEKSPQSVSYDEKATRAPRQDLRGYEL